MSQNDSSKKGLGGYAVVSIGFFLLLLFFGMMVACLKISNRAEKNLEDLKAFNGIEYVSLKRDEFSDCHVFSSEASVTVLAPPGSSDAKYLGKCWFSFHYENNKYLYRPAISKQETKIIYAGPIAH